MFKPSPGRRWSGWSARRASLLRPFPSLRVEELEARTTPSTFTWTGNGGNANWSNRFNWSGGAAPSGLVVGGQADDLSFPSSASARNTNNGIDTISLNISLGTSAGGGPQTTQSIQVNLNDKLIISGQLSGTSTVKLSKEQGGTLVLSGDNSAYFGPITVNNTSGTGPGTLEIDNANALGSSTAGTTVISGSTLAINVPGPIFEPITLNGPGLSNNGALQLIAGNATWAGPIVLDSDTTIGASLNTVLSIANTISDTGTGRNLIKEGLGEIQFNAANSYRGTTTVNNGLLTLGNPLALGSADRGATTETIVNETLTKAGQLRLGDAIGNNFTILNEALVLNGYGLIGSGGPSTGALFNALGNNSWAGPVNFGSGVSSTTFASIGGAANTDLIVSGVVTSSNGFTFSKLAPGRVIFNNKNTYTGATTVAAGILNIRDSKGLGRGSVTVNGGGTLQLE